MPTGHPRRSSSEQFYYNQDGMTKADWDRSRKEGEVTYIARDNPTWITNAIPARQGHAGVRGYRPLRPAEHV